MKGKLYIGRKVREVRLASGLTQAVFAERLGISTSYLNQIENNSRPVSAVVLLALADQFQIDVSTLVQGDSDRLASALAEALRDPIFESDHVSPQDLTLVARNAPSVAHALISAQQAFRRTSEQLTGLDSRIRDQSAVIEPSPYEEVRDFFHFVDNYVHELDVAAETLAAQLRLTEADPAVSLVEYLVRTHHIDVQRNRTDQDLIRRFDATAKILWVNSYSPTSTQTFQIAFQIATLDASELISSIIERAGFRTREAVDICRIGLSNYFAGALILPYATFLRAARELRHDLELLAVGFGASVEQVAHRLSTLQRPGQKGVPFFFARVDRAGNITKRHSAAKLQFARFGAACPLWNVHEAFEANGRIIRQLAETPDGSRYLSVATEISKGGAGYLNSNRRYAITIGCDISYAQELTYSNGLDIDDPRSYVPIGVSCRMCERTKCNHRAIPPLRARLIVDPNERRVVPYALSL